MKLRKILRRSGWITPKIEEKSMKFDEMKKEAMEPQPYYDDWMNYRDGLRNYQGKLKKEIKKEGRKIRLRRFRKRNKPVTPTK